MIPQTLTRRLARAALTVALVAPVALVSPATAHAAVFGISITVGTPPPPLPVYVQPPLPAPGYLWTPGYWAWGDAGYYWVPGTWVEPPQVGLLWTPGYWGYADSVYGWHPGYWGPQVGFYGGVNYGFGYGGVGFFGGEWRGGGFFYNSAVANFGSVHVTNVYENRTVIVNNTIINNTHVAYNGGPGGIQRQPTIQEQQFAQARHFQPTANQIQHQQLAAQDRGQLAAVNGGRPQTFATVNNAAYHQVAQQHMQVQPISAQDRQVGRTFNTVNLNRAAIANRPGGPAGAPGQANGFGARQANVQQQQRTQFNQQQNAVQRQTMNNAGAMRPNPMDSRAASLNQQTTNNREPNAGAVNQRQFPQQRPQPQVQQQQQRQQAQFQQQRPQPQVQQPQREPNRGAPEVREADRNDRRR